MARKPYPKRQYPNWAELDPSIDRLLAEGWAVEAIAKDLGFKADTVRAHLRKREAAGTPTEHLSTPSTHQDTPGAPPSTPDEPELLAVHPGTPEPTEILPDDQYTQEHPDTPPDPDHTEVHHGTLEGHQEVMDDVHQSVPDAPHIGTDEVNHGIPEHPSTPEVPPEVSEGHSSTVHLGVPSRQDHLISTPMVHPSTPSAEDWELWHTIKAMWPRVEKMLADQQVLLSTPGHTQKKTYVFDVRHIGLIDAYAQANRIELKDVIYLMCEEFFQHR